MYEYQLSLLVELFRRGNFTNGWDLHGTIIGYHGSTWKNLHQFVKGGTILVEGILEDHISRGVGNRITSRHGDAIVHWPFGNEGRQFGQYFIPGAFFDLDETIGTFDDVSDPRRIVQGRITNR